MNSIVSYKNRGAWGENTYRGNCSGYIFIDLVEHFKPKSFADVTLGGGTSRDVFLGQYPDIEFKGIDIHTGFDLTKNPLISVLKKPFEMVFSHLPYFDMIDYKKERERHQLSGKEGDLSKYKSKSEFLEFAHLALLNQREGTRKNGIYTSLIGDYRKNGKFYSFQSDFIQLMPKDELISVVVKMQHNSLSIFKRYRGLFIPIVHEYLIIWKKKGADIYQVIYEKAFELKNMQKATWRNLIRYVLMQFNSPVALKLIYERVEELAGEKVRQNKNYKAKIRQTLQYYFSNIEKGVWSI